MKKITETVLKPLLILLIAIISTASQANNTVEPLDENERNFVINTFNAFLSIPKSCKPVPYPKYHSSGSFAWDEFTTWVAEEEVKDLSDDDSLEEPDYENLLLKTTDQGTPIFSTIAPAYSPSTYFEVIHVSNTGDIFQLLSVEVLTNSSICETLMKANYNNGKIGLSRVVKQDLGTTPKYYWVLIVANGERVSFSHSGTPGLISPIYAQSPVSSQSEDIIDNLIMIEPPVRHSLVEDAQQDLIITSFEKISDVSKDPGKINSYKVSVRIVIENQGSSEAGSFRIGAWQGNNLSKSIPLTVVGQRDTWKPLVSTTLFPGELISLEGKIVFDGNLLNRAVKIYAIVDDCSDNISRSTGSCDVKEVNENNNISSPLKVIYK